MQIDIKNLSNSEIEISGEIPVDFFMSCEVEAVKNLSKEINIPGFRPGNVPEKILSEKIGRHSVLEEMAEIALRKFYLDILKEKKIDAIGRPEVVITKIADNNPLGFKIKTAVMPKFELGDYKKIAGKEMKEKKEEIIIDNKEIDASLEYLRKSRSQKNEKGEDMLLELNDDFAKMVGNFENIDALKNTIQENLKQEKEMKLKSKKRIKILDEIIKSNKIDIPAILIDAEKNKILNETKSNIENMGLKWGDYLSHLKKNEEEISAGLEESAIKRIKYGLILNKIAENEKINVLEEEIEKEADKMTAFYEKTGQKIDREPLRDYIYNILLNEKVFNLLEC